MPSPSKDCLVSWQPVQITPPSISQGRERERGERKGERDGGHTQADEGTETHTKCSYAHLKMLLFFSRNDEFIGANRFSAPLNCFPICTAGAVPSAAAVDAKKRKEKKKQKQAQEDSKGREEVEEAERK